MAPQGRNSIVNIVVLQALEFASKIPGLFLLTRWLKNGKIKEGRMYLLKIILNMKCSCCNINCLKCLGYGVIIWVVAFMVASVFVAFEVASDTVKNVATTLAVLLTAFLLAKNLKVGSVGEMLKYSFCWALIVFALDAIVTTRFTGLEFFYTWNMLLAYALIVIVPLFAVKKTG